MQSKRVETIKHIVNFIDKRKILGAMLPEFSGLARCMRWLSTTVPSPAHLLVSCLSSILTATLKGKTGMPFPTFSWWWSPDIVQLLARTIPLLFQAALLHNYGKLTNEPGGVTVKDLQSRVSKLASLTACDQNKILEHLNAATIGLEIKDSKIGCADRASHWAHPTLPDSIASLPYTEIPSAPLSAQHHSLL